MSAWNSANSPVVESEAWDAAVLLPRLPFPSKRARLHSSHPVDDISLPAIRAQFGDTQGKKLSKMSSPRSADAVWKTFESVFRSLVRTKICWKNEQVTEDVSWTSDDVLHREISDERLWAHKPAICREVWLWTVTSYPTRDNKSMVLK